ncbi:MAG: ABC transporter substrate-binding protein [Firmicutes bacterium]|nr:ABC transporter substrate-binding protein [Bacillota bacterium]
MYPRTRRITALLLAFTLAACLYACKPGAPDEPETAAPPATQAQPRDTLTLPFARQDVLNPYALTAALNRNLSTLLYEGLFLTDETWKARPVLAEKIEQTAPLAWLVTLRAGRVFHSGAAVTAADVVYSFNKARNTRDFEARLENISKCAAVEGAVEFTLRGANQYVAANLDFPIVPAGSAETGLLPEAKGGYLFTKASTPAGTGKYKLSERENAFVLEYDARHPGPAPWVTTIELYGTHSAGALLYGLEMGNYHFAYDNLNDGETARVNATTMRVPTTNLVYLGYNSNRGALQDAGVRAALGACINKAALLSEAFHSYARPTDTPFPPGWHGITQGDFDKPYNAAGARKALEDLGYTELKNGVRGSRHRQLSFTLLVNSDSPAKLAAARAVKVQLGTCQIAVDVQAVPEAQYLAAVRGGWFDMYIGEVRLTPDCSLAPLLLSGGAASAGINVWGAASSAYGQLLQGLIPAAKFVSVFQEEMPFLPLGCRDGMAAAVRGLRVPAGPRQGDLFCGIAEWEFLN